MGGITIVMNEIRREKNPGRLHRGTALQWPQATHTEPAGPLQKWESPAQKATSFVQTFPWEWSYSTALAASGWLPQSAWEVGHL